MEENNKIEVFSNIQAEKSLLGFLLLNNNSFEEVSEILNKECFFLGAHQNIFEIIKTLFNKSQVADVITVSQFAAYSKDSQDISFDYLVELVNSVVSLGTYKEYANLIYDMYLKRQVALLKDNINSYLNSNSSAKESIEFIERDIFHLAEVGAISKGMQNFSDSLDKAYEMATLAKSYSNGLSGVTTGLTDVDSKLGGLQKSDLIVLAGRPSMGKTALATNIAFNCASAFNKHKGYPGAPVVIFSLEMSSEQLAGRILSSQVGVSSDALRKGILNDGDFARLSAAVSNLRDTPIFIDDTPAVTVSQIRSKCRKLKRQHNLGLIIIDYIQLINGEKRSDSRVNEVSEITRGLKGIAKELDVPVIALSQLSRAVETRDDKKPMLADLRESGSIEQDADIVAFVYREEYYVARATIAESEKEKYKKWQDKLASVKNLATVIIAKNRHGPIGNIDLRFNPMKTEFANLDKIHIPNKPLVNKN